ncbi:hypothetical protein [Buchnera aphidicola]|uniref:hypothetical protein n=1 Tax=Buchnera aphidicola TaxID=9 RepID=UPI0002F7B1DE|nr:hypothetical protein [Buchnera aphidicola]
MKKKKYIVSQISGYIKKIYNIKKKKFFKKKIIFESEKNIIVSPCNGIIKSFFPKKNSCIIQNEINTLITIKNKIYNNEKKIINFISLIKNSKKIYIGEIIFLIKNIFHKIYLNKSITNMTITSKKKINTYKKKYKIKAGITKLFYL